MLFDSKALEQDVLGDCVIAAVKEPCEGWLGQGRSGW